MLLGALSHWPDHAFPPGTYDVRGWTVRTRADDEKAGTVHDILVDRRGVPRYLDVDLGIFRKHVLLPVGKARADREREVVWVPGHTRDQIRDLPGYDHALVDDDDAALTGAGLAAGTSEPRPPYPGAIYGPSELEERVTAPEEPRLVALGDVEDRYGVADDQPDIRGWDVVIADRSRAGTVAELIINTTALKVRYVVCALEDRALEPDERSRAFLIPIEYVRLDEASRSVLLDAIGPADLRELPAYSPDALGPELEEFTHRALARRSLETEPGEAYTDTRHFYGLDSE